MSEKLCNRITEYLSNGGLFNPEVAEHNKVRDLLIDCRDALTGSTGERVPLHCGCLGVTHPACPVHGEKASGTMGEFFTEAARHAKRERSSFKSIDAWEAYLIGLMEKLAEAAARQLEEAIWWDVGGHSARECSERRAALEQAAEGK